VVGDFGQQKTDTSTISSFERIYLRKPTRQFGQQADKPPETTYSDSGRRAGPGLGSEKLRAQCFQSEEIGQTANLAASDLLWSYSFLQEDLPHMSELGKDGPPIIDLAEKLVAHAFAPKDSFKITKIANWVFT